MESVSSSVLNKPLPSPSYSFAKSSNQRTGSLKFSESSRCAALGLRLRIHAQAREVPNEGEDDKPSDNGIGSAFGDAVSLSQTINGCIRWLLRLSSDGFSHILKGNTNQNPSGDKDADNLLKIETPHVVPHGSGTSGGTRAGLFRTPISGGVQSATSAHGLPRPALAVRNLMEQARFAHLCTVMSRMHHRREGYPFGSLVDFAPDSMGHPIFSFSPLAIHTRNLLADPRCTLVVQEWAHKQYIAKHHQGPSQQWGNFYYFRMQDISDIYFIGGFGTVAWVDVKEYEALLPDKIAVEGGEHYLKELNAAFSKLLKELLSAETEVDDAAIISLDSKGIDVRVRQGAQFNIQRVTFEDGHTVETLDEAKTALGKRSYEMMLCFYLV
ncbi:Pyridoxamine 5'-phosphate oxidase family protein [Citrus sinensis]|nr:Pyridoxamine 5'-phosphate oxidase family protein [Citrus sinensis]